MSSVLLPDRRTEGEPPPYVAVTTTLNGVTFTAGRRTAAHLTWTDERLRAKGKWLRVIQPPYNSGVAASAGTHDWDGCLDVEVEGMSWDDAQSELRRLGWAAWYRPFTPGLWNAHIHMVSIGCPGPVGIFVPGQVADYYAGRSGLKGHALDPTWRPADIDSTVFDYAAWTEEQDMSPEQEDRIVKRVVEAILAAPVGGEKDPATVKQTLNQIRTAVKRGAK